jgi:D-cysteine desulfhydrase family pyridoxal phosphate-dependent enzyme
MAMQSTVAAADVVNGKAGSDAGVRLETWLEGRPRARLGIFPTPLEAAPRFSAALGGVEVLLKRDDLTNFAFGGNKTRNLEFMLGEALATGADCIVTGADTQSNQCRQAAAAAAKLGLDCYLVLAAGEHTERQGNLLLDHLYGAHVHVVEGVNLTTLQAHADTVEERLKAEGRRPYRITSQYPHLALKAMTGYLSAAVELESELRERAIEAATIVICSGSGTTHTGLAAGLKALGGRHRVIGISILNPAEAQRAKIVALSQRCAEANGLACALSPDEVDVRDTYIGDGYGKVTAAGLEAISLLARTEAVILDPVYTGKTMAGLIDLVRKGEIGRDAPVVFVHTGGVPAIFAYHDELSRGVPSPAVTIPVHV